MILTLRTALSRVFIGIPMTPAGLLKAGKIEWSGVTTTIRTGSGSSRDRSVCPRDVLPALLDLATLENLGQYPMIQNALQRSHPQPRLA
jgi:hypothetical protein